MNIDRVRAKAYVFFPFFFFIAFFLYLWLKVNPSFHVLEQNITFLGTWRFLHECLSYPGGVIDYCSAFLSFFFRYPIVGAIVITALLLLLSYATRHLLRLLFGPRKRYAVHLLPVVLCGGLQSSYSHPLSITIALITALFFFVLYGSWRFHRASVRIPIYLILAVCLYYCAGGTVLLFSLLCMLYEMIVIRRWAVGLFYGVVAATVPYLSKACLFLVSTHEAYLHLLPFDELGYNIKILPYVLYTFYPTLFLVALGNNLLEKRKSFSVARAALFQSIGTPTKAFISYAALIAVTR
jgi:hypothetical protein